MSKNAVGASLFFQCLLCCVIIFSGLSIRYRQNNKAVEVSGFGYNQQSNDSFSDLAQRLYESFGEIQ